jgi:polyhydroxybutyrate depolymerase
MLRWSQRNQCASRPRRTLDQAGAYCERYEGCAGGVPVQLCVTETGGHSWPGASVVRRGKAPASTALDASATIWRFFEAASR